MSNKDIRAYCARRDANPLEWETEEDTGPVFDKGTFGETYDFDKEHSNG